MDKEVLELLKTMAGGTGDLLVLYMALDFLKVLVGWVGAGVCAYLFGMGFRKVGQLIADS